MASPKTLDIICKLRQANEEMYKRLKEMDEDDHEHEWMSNGHCAWCGESYDGH